MIRRLPMDIPYTHRGAALLYNDDTIELEAEDLQTLEFPKQKFPKPVAAAVFFYGFADDDTTKGKEPIQDQHGLAQGLVPGLRTDITFPGLSPDIPVELRASVARLHINAGHPSRQEMTRLLNCPWCYIISDLVMCGTPRLRPMQENLQSSTSSTSSHSRVDRSVWRKTSS